jgi:deoxyribonuclease V
LPDLILADGQGIAHPRRLGLASHLGVLLDRPVIGVAKSRLIGAHSEVGDAAGSTAPLCDGDELIGMVVRTRSGVKPLYVSVGHRITLEEAVHWVLSTATRYRLPEPARSAHLLSKNGLP